MPTTPINGLRKPARSDSPDGPLQISNLADDVDSRLVGRFATTTERDAKIPSPTDGMICYVAADDYYYERVNGAWVKRTNFGGFSGTVSAGVVPAAGRQLLTKVVRDSVSFNSLGEATVTFPGSFSNGVLGVQATVNSPNPFMVVIMSNTLGSVNLRGYNVTSGGITGSLTYTVVVTAWGW